MTSVMEKLCKLLDEHGVEYETDEHGVVKWSTHYGAFVFFARQRDGKLLVETTVATEHSVILTPEQIIYETLDRGTLTANDVLNALHKYGARWSAIADELINEYARRIVDELESWTCEVETEFRHDYGGEGSDTYEFVLSCGHSVEWLYSEPPRHCPDCGKLVSDE